MQFYLKDIPEDEIIHYYIKKHSGFYEAIEKFSSYDYSKPCIKELPQYVVDLLWESCQEAFEKYGWYGFFKGNIIEDNQERAKNYGGLSLTYNPYHWQADNLPVNAQTLGEVRYNLGTLFEDDRGKKIWDDLVHANKRTVFYEIIGKQTLEAGFDYLLEEKFIDAVEYNELCTRHFDHKNNPIAEKDLWTPNVQESKISQYGGKNIRYRVELKRKFIKDFVDLHTKVIPWNTIRYIF